MELSIRIADPAGNITIFVMSAVSPQQYASVAAMLLADSRFRAEQVAFHVAPKRGADGRIEMMGGEFCGNATRSYGYLLSALLPNHPSEVKVEISGADHPLLVKIDCEHGRCETQMPLPAGKGTIKFEGEEFDAIHFDGIIHIIVPGASRGQHFVDGLFATAKSKVDSSAYGIMFLDGDNMTPVVYVCETDSVVWESSCGSGSMAVAVLGAITQINGVCHRALQQPGGIIEAVARAEGGRVVQCSMGGPVSLSKEIKWTMPKF
ncbi:hypothetical protein ACS3UN_08240 [Oscillospiraceae bacterium LTW-04]|nr:hypothetical protein RBH76_02110 [Oscillospiraceae bacterium MB24-C1]